MNTFEQAFFYGDYSELAALAKEILEQEGTPLQFPQD